MFQLLQIYYRYFILVDDLLGLARWLDINVTDSTLNFNVYDGTENCNI